MLNAYANRLKSLAETSFGQFRDEVSQKMNGRATDEQISALKEFIFLLPATLQQMNTYWNKKTTPPDAKKVSGFILTYILQPNDYISEEKHGLFGYIDDAYFVVRAYLQLHERFLRDWHEVTPGERELIERARRLIVAPRLLIPQEAGKIDQMIESLLNGDKEEFELFIANHRNED